MTIRHRSTTELAVDQLPRVLSVPRQGTPACVVPRVETLQDAVGKRRRVRRAWRTSRLIVLASGIAFGGQSLWPGPWMPDRDREQHAAAPGVAESVTVSAASEGGDAVIDPEFPGLPSPGVRVFARISHLEPVFEIDDAAQTARQVGWIEQEERVPVSLQAISRRDQEVFHRVLERPADPLSL